MHYAHDGYSDYEPPIGRRTAPIQYSGTEGNWWTWNCPVRKNSQAIQPCGVLLKTHDLLPKKLNATVSGRVNTKAATGETPKYF